MENPRRELLRNRGRVVDTPDARHLIKRPYELMTESLEFYAKYAWYDKSLIGIRFKDKLFLIPENTENSSDINKHNKYF